MTESVELKWLATSGLVDVTADKELMDISSIISAEMNEISDLLKVVQEISSPSTMTTLTNT